jgi:ferric-dicitrate binding protein FerR (iron transport regulator)
MHQSIENILAKYFAGEASQEEQNLVNQWKESHPQLFESYRRAYHTSFFESKTFSSKRPGFVPKGRVIQPAFLLKVAAIFVGLMIVGAALYFYAQSLNVRYVNTTASVQHILLPDGSEVYLDKHATLQFKKSFFGNFNRKVAMTGRVFFHVFRDPAHPFTVNAGILKVKVLGTRFTVNQMAVKTQVVLTHGKVLVNSTKISHGVILQKTGDQVIIQNDGCEKENNVKASLYASWMDKKIYFNECTVKEVVDMLYDSYNLKVAVHDSGFLSKKLFGSAPSDDPKLIVDALSQILHTEIQSK